VKRVACVSRACGVASVRECGVPPPPLLVADEKILSNDTLLTCPRGPVVTPMTILAVDLRAGGRALRGGQSRKGQTLCCVSTDAPLFALLRLQATQARGVACTLRRGVMSCPVLCSMRARPSLVPPLSVRPAMSRTCSSTPHPLWRYLAPCAQPANAHRRACACVMRCGRWAVRRVRPVTRRHWHAQAMCVEESRCRCMPAVRWRARPRCARRLAPAAAEYASLRCQADQQVWLLQKRVRPHARQVHDGSHAHVHAWAA
jgi:hypothetical protein